MVLGTALQTYTVVHVIISLIGIASGLIVLYGLLAGGPMPKMTAIFLIFNVLTDVTGFLFPFHGFLPSYAVGVLSLIALGIAIAGRYVYHLAGRWRAVYAVGIVVALYLNVFVAVVQSFEKIHGLAALGGHAMPVVQLLVLVGFAAMGALAIRRARMRVGVTAAQQAA